MQQEISLNLRGSSTQNLVSLSSREQGQHGREQQRANQQDADANPGRVGVESPLLVFDQVVQQVDRHDQQRNDHGRDDEAGAEVYALAGEVFFGPAAGFELGFLAGLLIYLSFDVRCCCCCCILASLGEGDLRVNRTLAVCALLSASLLPPYRLRHESRVCIQTSMPSTHIEKREKSQPQHTLNAPVEPGVVPTRP